MATSKTTAKEPGKKKAPPKKKPGRPPAQKAQPKPKAEPTTLKGKTPIPNSPPPKIAGGRSGKVDVENIANAAGVPPSGSGVAAAAPTDAPGFDGAILAPACKILTRIGGRFAGYDLVLTDDEAKLLGDALGPVLDKWMPSGEEWAAEINLIIVAGLVIGGKVAQENEQRNRDNFRAKRDGEIEFSAGADK